VKLKGGAIGSLPSADHFGITAQQIAKLIVGEAIIPLTDEADNVLLDPVTGDFRAVDFT